MYRPMLPIVLRGPDRIVEREFPVDSGADLSMAPYELCRQLGLRWRDGIPLPVQGISKRRASVIQGRIHDVELIIPDGGVIVRIPIIFARGNASYVLGRDDFFDLFTITFDATRRRTVFELADD